MALRRPEHERELRKPLIGHPEVVLEIDRRADDVELAAGDGDGRARPPEGG